MRSYNNHNDLEHSLSLWIRLYVLDVGCVNKWRIDDEIYWIATEPSYDGQDGQSSCNKFEQTNKIANSHTDGFYLIGFTSTCENAVIGFDRKIITLMHSTVVMLSKFIRGRQKP